MNGEAPRGVVGPRLLSDSQLARIHHASLETLHSLVAAADERAGIR